MRALRTQQSLRVARPHAAQKFQHARGRGVPVKVRTGERARRDRLASSPTTSSTRETAGKPEQVLDTHWCVYLNLPSGLGSSDERAVWATSDNQLSAEATEELERTEAVTCMLEHPSAQAVKRGSSSRPGATDEPQPALAEWKRQSTSTAPETPGQAPRPEATGRGEAQSISKFESRNRPPDRTQARGNG